jgi:hypothetical protein
MAGYPLEEGQECDDDQLTYSVIPAKAGIQYPHSLFPRKRKSSTSTLSFPRKRESSTLTRHSPESGNPAPPLCHSRESGIQHLHPVIPESENPGPPLVIPPKGNPAPPLVIPAKAGIQDFPKLLLDLLDSRFRGNDGKVRKSIRFRLRISLLDSGFAGTIMKEIQRHYPALA